MEPIKQMSLHQEKRIVRNINEKRTRLTISLVLFMCKIMVYCKTIVQLI